MLIISPKESLLKNNTLTQKKFKYVHQLTNYLILVLLVNTIFYQEKFGEPKNK
jgi:hypothetical protein